MDTVWSPHRLRAALRQAGMEIADLAAATGLTIWAIYKYAKPTKPTTPPARTARLIADALGVDVADLEVPRDASAPGRGEVA